MNQKLKRYFYHYRKEVGLGVLCFFVCVLFCIFLLPKPKASNHIEEELDIVAPVEEATVVQEEPVIRVDIKGAVVSPGVYEMRETARVNDVIYQAGGVLENADLSRINLSKRVTDEMVIIIYTKEQIAAYNESKTEIEYIYVEPDCTCPDLVNDACTTPKEDSSNTMDQKISINTASKEQLEALPGIGASKAEAIMEYRENKPFDSIEELQEIKGIGESVFEKLKEYITI